MARIIFVTGTDTGVGKTVCAAWLLHHLRRMGVNALAMKPLCSGNRNDVRALQRQQPGRLTILECNPYFFRRALAPGVAAELTGETLTKRQVLRQILRVGEKCQVLLVEGAGGVMVPAGRGFLMRDLVEALDCDVIVVARNRLGTINHTLLTLEALEKIKPRSVKVAMMDRKERDASSGYNIGYLRRTMGKEEVVLIPDLGAKPLEMRVFATKYKKLKKVLARLLD